MKKLHIIWNKSTMQWQVKFGRLAVFVTDNYDIAKDYVLQYEADHDADKKEYNKRKAV